MAADRARRIAVLALFALLLMAAFAVPVAADPGNGQGGGQGNGGGNGGSGSSNGGGGNGGGGSNGGSNAGGNGGGNSGGSGGGQGSGSSASSSSSGGSDQGASGSSSNRGSDPPGHGSGESPQEASSEQSGAKRPSNGHPAGEDVEEPTVDSAQTDGPASSHDAGPTSSSSGGDGTTTLIDFITDTVASSGQIIKAIESRSDMAELFSTDVDSPAVSAAMVLLTAGIMSGLYGTVRTARGGLVGRPHRSASHPDQEETAALQDAAIAAGLPADRWTALEPSTYRKLLRMDVHTVAFWMGSDLAAVRRWQAGRTLADDVQDGIAVPQRHTDGEVGWNVPPVGGSTNRPAEAEATPAGMSRN